MAHLISIILLLTLISVECDSSSSVILDRIKSLKVSCPCLKPFGEPIKTVKTGDVTGCFSVCHATASCTGFSYCAHSRQCSSYSSETLGYTAGAVNSFDCPNNPFDSPLDWYLKAENFDANTTNCQDLHDLGMHTDGYYNVSIRGRQLQVYCLMSVTPIKTYTDISAYTKYGGYGPSGTPAVTVTYSRAELKYDKCLILLVKRNQQFTNPQTGDVGKGIGMGGNCLTSENGKHEIDLRMTQFQFSSDVQFILKGWNTVLVSQSFTPRYSYVEGRGECGYINSFNKDDPSHAYDDYIPLQLFPKT